MGRGSLSWKIPPKTNSTNGAPSINSEPRHTMSHGNRLYLNRDLQRGHDEAQRRPIHVVNRETSELLIA